MVNKINVEAPAVVKLFGEHAVIYGKLSIAAALKIYARSSVEKIDDNKFEIELKDLNKYKEFSNEDLESIYENYIKKEDYDSFIRSQNIDSEILPYAVIAGKIRKTRNISITNIKVIIKSDIPIQKGLASSAACSTAFTVALLKYFNINLPDKEVIELAREGDKIIHRNDNAGRIDVSTSYYGGYVSYSVDTGAKKENIDNIVGLMLIDTGPKKSTAETVNHVAMLYKENKSKTEEILCEIEKCSRDGLSSLKENNLIKLGELMYKNHELLANLGVSSEGLENAVHIVKRNNGFGAKLSGGGGGGLAIALLNNRASDKLINDLKSYNYSISTADISLDGAKMFINTNPN
ncbi:MAG: mevalonate kinase [Candidatus Micrarchaeia archaeon]